MTAPLLELVPRECWDELAGVIWRAGGTIMDSSAARSSARMGASAGFWSASRSLDCTPLVLLGGSSYDLAVPSEGIAVVRLLAEMTGVDPAGDVVSVLRRLGVAPASVRPRPVDPQHEALRRALAALDRL